MIPEGPVADLVALAALLSAVTYIAVRLRSGWQWAKAQLIAIVAETKPNGGTSLRDSINRIEGKVTAIVEQQAINGHRLERGDVRFDEQDLRLKRIEVRLSTEHNDIIRAVEETATTEGDPS